MKKVVSFLVVLLLGSLSTNSSASVISFTDSLTQGWTTGNSLSKVANNAITAVYKSKYDNGVLSFDINYVGTLGGISAVPYLRPHIGVVLATPDLTNTYRVIVTDDGLARVYRETVDSMEELPIAVNCQFTQPAHALVSIRADELGLDQSRILGDIYISIADGYLSRSGWVPEPKHFGTFLLGDQYLKISLGEEANYPDGKRIRCSGFVSYAWDGNYAIQDQYSPHGIWIDSLPTGVTLTLGEQVFVRGTLTTVGGLRKLKVDKVEFKDGFSGPQKPYVINLKQLFGLAVGFNPSTGTNGAYATGLSVKQFGFYDTTTHSFRYADDSVVVEGNPTLLDKPSGSYTLIGVTGRGVVRVTALEK